MPSNPFFLSFDRLPQRLPIFPLADAIVMPGSQLPLNIFEPRYLNLVLDVLGRHRLIGMVQPNPAGEGESPVYLTGTAGRIVSFSETPDKRLLIVLTGVCRFDIVGETLTERGYREAMVDWTRFARDYEPLEEPPEHERARFLELLRGYFQRRELDGNWQVVEAMPVTLLVNVLTGQLPLGTSERQALVEEVSAEARLAKLVHLLEFELASGTLGDGTRH